MDTIKNAIGLGQQTQEGQEPVSGQQGAGNAAEPFDAGNTTDNAELGGKAPQETDPSKVTGNVSSTNPPPAADSATGSGKSYQTPQPPPPPAESETSKPIPSSNIGDDEDVRTPAADSGEAKQAIGSAGWFRTAIPPEQRKAEATGNAGEGTQSSGNTAPLGQHASSADVAGDVDTRKPTPATTTTPPAPAPIPSTSQAEPKQPDPMSAPREREVQSSRPHAIPVAGGTQVGEAAAKDRERRRSSIDPGRTGSGTEPAPAGNKFDDTTSKNTAANTGTKPDHRPSASGGGAAAAATGTESSSSPGSGKEKENEGRGPGKMEKLKEKLHIGHHSKDAK